MEIDLKKLFLKQSELDEEIARRHQITYESSFDRRLIALFTELAEFANATRCFKFWSNKKSEDKDIVLDEYADALHFLLSLGLAKNIKNYHFNFENKYHSLNEGLLDVYHLISDFGKNPIETNYHKLFESFLSLGALIGSFEEIKNAYLKKLDVNFKRQENNY